MVNVYDIRINVEVSDVEKKMNIDFQDMLKSKIAKSLANFIVENLDNMPIKYEIKETNWYSEIHSIKLFLISKSELERLSIIEEKYYKILERIEEKLKELETKV